VIGTHTKTIYKLRQKQEGLPKTKMLPAAYFLIQSAVQKFVFLTRTTEKPVQATPPLHVQLVGWTGEKKEQSPLRRINI